MIHDDEIYACKNIQLKDDEVGVAEFWKRRRWWVPFPHIPKNCGRILALFSPGGRTTIVKVSGRIHMATYIRYSVVELMCRFTLSNREVFL